jgi:hypothetical protein
VEDRPPQLGARGRRAGTPRGGNTPRARCRSAPDALETARNAPEGPRGRRGASRRRTGRDRLLHLPSDLGAEPRGREGLPRRHERPRQIRIRQRTQPRGRASAEARPPQLGACRAPPARAPPRRRPAWGPKPPSYRPSPPRHSATGHPVSTRSGLHRSEAPATGHLRRGPGHGLGASRALDAPEAPRGGSGDHPSHLPSDLGAESRGREGLPRRHGRSRQIRSRQ